MFRSSPGRPPPAAPGPHSPHPRPSGAFPFRRGPPAFGPGPPKPCGRGPQLPTAALRRGRGAFRLLRPESSRRKTKGTPPPFRTAFSSASSSPPRPKGRRPLRPPLTADRIPPAARSGSSACAAPRPSPGAAPRMRARFSDAAPAGGSPADVRRSAPGRPEAPDFRVGAPPAAEAENASKVLNFSGNAFRGVEIR